MAWRSRIGRAAMAAGLLVGAGVLPVVTAAPAAASACNSSTGVTVVVDYQGSISVGCASSPSDGLDALDQAGHAYTFVHNQPGLVCQIDTEPNPCNGAKTNAYWSYWHAARGGRWSYSNEGAGTYDPAPGSVEGWSFGAGSPPEVVPPDPAVGTTSSSRTTITSTTSATFSQPTSTSHPTSTSLVISTSTPTQAPAPPGPTTRSSTRPPAGTHSSSTSESSPASQSGESSESSTAVSTSRPATSRPPTSRPATATTRPATVSPPAASRHPTPAPPRSPPQSTALRAVPSAAATSSSADAAPSTAPADPSVLRTASAAPDSTGSAGGWWGLGLGVAALLGLGGAALAVRSRRPGP